MEMQACSPIGIRPFLELKVMTQRLSIIYKNSFIRGANIGIVLKNEHATREMPLACEQRLFSVPEAQGPL